MTNLWQSEILFLDVKMKNTPIIQVFSIDLIKMKDIASKNPPSNTPRYFVFIMHAIDPLEAWVALNSIYSIVSQLNRNCITTIAIVSQ